MGHLNTGTVYVSQKLIKHMAKLVKVPQGLGGEKKRKMGERMKAPKRKGKEYGQMPFRPSENVCAAKAHENQVVAATQTSNLLL